MIVSMQRRALQDCYDCVEGNVEGNSPECMHYLSPIPQ